MSTTIKRRLVSAGVCLALAGPGGCDTVGMLPPEAALAGLWLLSAPQGGDLNGKQFFFDADGRLEEIRTPMGNSTLIERNVHQETVVNGLNVLIRTSGNLTFEGTFNADMTVITGKLTSEFIIPFTDNTIVTDHGTGTLTKQ